MAYDLGKVYTNGNSFRARAEARQRDYRERVLKAGWTIYGHLLDEQSATAGRNFVSPVAFEAAESRQSAGKGISKRTFINMLSSQAMCFNIFAPLASDVSLATDVLSLFFPTLSQVTKVQIEYTPDNQVFGDQTGRGGVDCDVLVQGNDVGGQSLVIVIETKFVELEFSICGFRKPGRNAKGLAVCHDDVKVAQDTNHCLYTSRKGYLYWEKTTEHRILLEDALPESGCPFRGPLWQLWVNYTLAHAEAARWGTQRAFFAVIAPIGNVSLLQDDRVIEQFRRLLVSPESVIFIDSDQLIGAIRDVASVRGVQRAEWVDALVSRYTSI